VSEHVHFLQMQNTNMICIVVCSTVALSTVCTHATVGRHTINTKQGIFYFNRALGKGAYGFIFRTIKCFHLSVDVMSMRHEVTHEDI